MSLSAGCYCTTETVGNVGQGSAGVMVGVILPAPLLHSLFRAGNRWIMDEVKVGKLFYTPSEKLHFAGSSFHNARWAAIQNRHQWQPGTGKLINCSIKESARQTVEWDLCGRRAEIFSPKSWLCFNLRAQLLILPPFVKRKKKNIPKSKL